MRTSAHENTPILTGYVNHPHGEELEEIDRIVAGQPALLELVRGDLTRFGQRQDTGRPGMTAEQVLRCVVVKQVRQFSYDELVFALADSQCYRTFCRIGALGIPPTRSTLQSNIKALRAATLEAVNRAILGVAKEERIELGTKTRSDGTVVGTDIHLPTDSSLLFDAVRVLSRLVGQAKEKFGVRGANHTRRAKRRALEVMNAKTNDARKRAYHDLLKVTRKAMRQAGAVASQLRTVKTNDLLGEIAAKALANELERVAVLADGVVYQTTERVFHGRDVPADEKLFSLFETHTDIIIKDRRAVQFGHKVTFTTGKSTMIIDLAIEDGNPADSTLAVRTIERQKEIYGKPPRQSAMDGAYASKVNLDTIKQLGVRDMVFSKKRGLKEEDMARSPGIFRNMRNFRAGIEGGISLLKRCFGLRRCTWKGPLSFAAYVWSSVVAANLLILARLHIKKERAARAAQAQQPALAAA